MSIKISANSVVWKLADLPLSLTVIPTPGLEALRINTSSPRQNVNSLPLKQNQPSIPNAILSL